MFTKLRVKSQLGCNDATSERPNRSGSGSVRPNLEVRWGSAEPAQLKVRSTEPPPNQITTYILFFPVFPKIGDILAEKNFEKKYKSSIFSC